MTPPDLAALLNAEEQRAWRACLAQSSVQVRRTRDILAIGDRAEAVIIVKSGWIQRYRQLRGRRQVVSLYLPGEICDQSVWSGQAATTALTGVRDVEFALVAPEEAMALYSRFLGIERLFRANHVVHERIEREWMVSLGLRNAEERIAHLCCELLVRQGCHLTGAVSMPLPLNQAQIGEVVGLTSVHVNRAIASMRGRFGLSARGQRLEVADAAGLADFVRFDGSYLSLRGVGLCAAMAAKVPHHAARAPPRAETVFRPAMAPAQATRLAGAP